MIYCVQFYHKETLMWDRKREVTTFKNGFSSVWNKIENIIWIDTDSPSSEIFPYREGVVLASVYYKKELELVIKWAEANPDMMFHIGGPIVDTWPLAKNKHRPNIISHHKTLIEEFLFNEKIASRSDWNLKLPESDASDIVYGFSISKKNGCWWRRCTYCKQKTVPIYLNNYEIPIIDYPGTKHIWINTYCMRPRDIKAIYPNLPDRDDVRYATYLKLNHWSMEALYKAFDEMKCDPKNLAFNVGIDIPSQRVLDIFDRGVSLVEYINGLNFLLEHKCKIHINLILRLGFLQESDVDDVQLLADCISHNDLSNLSGSIYRLHISPERPLWDYLIQNGVFVQPTDRHVWDCDLYNIKMTQEQLELDNKVLKIYEDLKMDYLWNTIPEGE